MRKIILLLLLCTSFINCKKGFNAPKNFDYGTVKKGMYDNPYFRFKFPVNEGWYILSEAEQNAVYELGYETISGDNQVEKVIEAADITVAKLISVFKYELGANVDFNPSLLINAENLNNNTLVNTREAYLKFAKNILQRSFPNVEFLEESDDVKVGTETFSFVRMNNPIAGIDVTQDYYMVLKEGFALAFILSYTTDDDKLLLYKMFDKIKI